MFEWRVAPDSEWRNPHLGPPNRRLVLICAHGCSSSLAAARLVELGLDATDVIDGFEAWSAAGLPAVERRPRVEDELPGMGGPEPCSG